jgi:hypothetical protein
MWAAACAFLIWIAACAAAIPSSSHAAAGPPVMMDLVRERFPLLVAIVLPSLPLVPRDPHALSDPAWRNVHLDGDGR